MKLEAVAEILHAQGIAIKGQNLYIHNMPEGVQDGLLLLDDPDMPTEIDEYIPKLRKSNFRVIVRKKAYEEAMALAGQVSAALNLYNQTVNGLKFLRLRPTYDPIAFPNAESDVIEVSVNLWAAYIEP